MSNNLLYIFTVLDNLNISYIVVEGLHNKQYDNKFKQDLDLILDCQENDILPYLNNMKEFRNLEKNSFLDIKNNLRIDLYFNFLNVGYYHYLKFSGADFDKKRISSINYIIYQIIDPILKFSFYHERHKKRLIFYFSNRRHEDVKKELGVIFGSYIANFFINKLQKSEFTFSRFFIKICKLRLLFINGNFVRMLKSRIL